MSPPIALRGQAWISRYTGEGIVVVLVKVRYILDKVGSSINKPYAMMSNND